MARLSRKYFTNVLNLFLNIDGIMLPKITVKPYIEKQDKRTWWPHDLKKNKAFGDTQFDFQHLVYKPSDNSKIITIKMAEVISHKVEKLMYWNIPKI